MDEAKAYLSAIVIHYWEKWIADHEGTQHTPSEAEKIIVNAYHATPTSPLALMFAAFEAGLGYGLELADEMDRIAAAKHTPQE